MKRLYGETDKALQILQQHQRSEPKNKNFLFTLGDVLNELKRHHEAKDALTELVEITPEVVDFTVSLAKTLLKFLRLRRAIALLKKAIADYPDQL